MKKLIIILSLICMVGNLYAKNDSDRKATEKTKCTLNCDGIDFDYSEVDDYANHYLGDEIAKQYAAIKELYVRRNKVAVGFSNTTVDIAKPSIYNSVNKINTYLKKAIKKNSISEEQAIKQMERCLEIAYIAFYRNSTSLEETLKDCKDVEKMMEIYNSVELISNN